MDQDRRRILTTEAKQSGGIEHIVLVAGTRRKAIAVGQLPRHGDLKIRFWFTDKAMAETRLALP